MHVYLLWPPQALNQQKYVLLQDFVLKEGFCTVEDMFKVIKSEVEHGKNRKARRILNLIVKAADMSTFYNMMETKAKQIEENLI